MSKLEWFACVVTVIGNMFLILGRPEIVVYSYLFFLVGNFLWMKIALNRDMKALLVMNIIFLIMSVVGFINWYNL